MVVYHDIAIGTDIKGCKALRSAHLRCVTTCLPLKTMHEINA